MFEKFGEFDSVEELNLAAAGQKAEGDTKSLYELAEENGIDREDAEDYLNGDMEELATLSTAAFGRIIVERKEIKNDKDKMKAMALCVIITILNSMCADPEIQAAVMKKGKRIEQIYSAMKDAASKHKSGSVGISCGTDRDLENIIRVYYLEKESKFKNTIENLYR